MLKLIINNQQVDIGTNKNSVDIKLNRNFLDLNKIDSRGGDFSYSIKLPKSKINCTIFENAHVINSIDKFVRDEEYIAKLMVGGMSSLDGLFKLVEITEDSFDGILISNNISWARLIEGKNLNELKNGDGTPWGFDYIGASGSSVQNSFAWHVENDTYSNSDVCWPLIPRGYFFTNDTGNTNNTYFYDHSLSTSDVPPAVYQLKIVKKIFENIGWNVDGDLFGEEEHKRLFLPYTNDSYYKYNTHLLYAANTSGSTFKVNYPVAYPENFSSFWTNTSNPILSTSIYYFNPSIQNYDPLDRVTSVSFSDIDGITRQQQNYYVAASGYMDIDLHFKFTQDTGFLQECTTYSTYGVFSPSVIRDYNKIRGGFFLYFYQDQQTTNDIFQNLTKYIYEVNTTPVIDHSHIIFFYDVYQSTIFGTANSYQPYDQDADISVVNNAAWSLYVDSQNWDIRISGGTIDVAIKNLYLGNTENLRLGWIGPGYTNAPYLTAGQTLALDEVSWSFAASSGSTLDIVNIAENLPAVSQLDFLKSWISMNNLFLSYNPDTKTVRFDTFNAFFLSNEKAIDITNNVDTNYGEPYVKPIALPRNLYFKYNNDSGDYYLSQDKDFAKLQSTSDNIYTSGDQTIDCIYSATKSRNYYFVPSGVTVSLPIIATSSDINITDLTTIDWSFNSNIRILKRDEFLVDGSGNTVYIMVDGYPTKILTSIFDDQRENRLSLNWGTENGLYKNYYERFLSEIGDSHILALNSNINNFQFTKLEPQYPVKIQNQHYFLNLIDGFSPAKEGTTKIELIKKFTN